MKVRVDLATGRARVPRRAGRAGPRREEGRPVPRARRGPGRADVPRPPGVAARTTDESLYGLGQQQLGLARPQGLRPRPVAAQRHGGRALPRLEPRLRHPLGQHRRTRASATCGPGSPSRPPASSTRRASPAASPARTTPARASRRWWRRASIPGSTIAVPGGAKQPNLRIHPSLPPEGEVERALGGSGRGDRDAATTSSSSTRTAGSACGSTAGWWPTTGARAGCPGSTSRACRSRRADARAQDRVVEGPGDGDGAAPVEDAGAGALDVALVRGRRRRRLLLRLRPEPRPRGRRLPAADRRGADDAALGLRPLAEPAALRDAAAEPRRGGRLPLAADPVRQHRAGLVLLAGERVGLAPLRPRALPRPRRLGRADPRAERAAHDLGLGQVLPGHRELRGDAREGLPLRDARCAPASRTGSAPATPTPSTTPSTPRRGSSSGRR